MVCGGLLYIRNTSHNIRNTFTRYVESVRCGDVIRAALSSALLSRAVSHLWGHPLSVQSVATLPPFAAPLSPFPATSAPPPPRHRGSFSTSPVRRSFRCHSRAVATSSLRMRSSSRLFLPEMEEVACTIRTRCYRYYIYIYSLHFG